MYFLFRGSRKEAKTMARPITLKQNARGSYARSLGYIQNGGQPKFYLGDDQSEAVLRNARLEKLWEWNCQECRTLFDGKRPWWEPSALLVAKAFAAGLAIRTPFSYW